MSCYTVKTKLLLRRLVILQQKRFKKKTAYQAKQKTHKEVALQFFDTFYSQHYGVLWPSIRISLLSKQKYCALLNSLDDYRADQNELKLADLGAYDFVDHAKNTATVSIEKSDPTKVSHSIEDAKTNQNQNENEGHERIHETSRVDLNCSKTADTDLGPNSILSHLVRPVDDKNTGLYDFIPADRVYSERELKDMKVIESSTFDDHDVPLSFMSEEFPVIPKSLKAFCFERGNIDLFPDPLQRRGKKLGYYLMDAASLLPVIALNILKNDHVLDMCSAPGGKMLAMLQYQHSGGLVCNDSSKSRLQRLSRILDTYANQTLKDVVMIENKSGTDFIEPVFDKVLVDAPCTNDRHSVLEDDNNMFKPGRLDERLEIPRLQQQLLVSAIKSCKPGGEVVYSTCSLSPAQNDGVIQAAVEFLWKETNIDVCVVNLDYISEAFRETFNFYPKCRFGQLVVPNLTANFGPMYFCKLKRLDT